MNITHDQRVAELFKAAIGLAELERSAFLSSECGEDATLRSEIQRLLELDSDSQGLLAPPDFNSSTDLRAQRCARQMVGQTIGHYRIIREIASGGMGAVYEAQQEHPRRSVALKLMRSGLVSRSSLRRFEYEAQLLGRLRHPGIAQVYEAGTHPDPTSLQDEDVPFFAMEFVPNARPLIDYANHTRLSERQRIELFVEVCDAVQHGHQNGVIHRDLKPSNILVDSSGRPKLIDFGVARATDSDLATITMQTSVGQLVGTLQYMSPEQCSGESGTVPDDLDIRCDVYSLGVVLYELMCGRVPYDVARIPVLQATQLIREQAPARPSAIRRTVRGDLETVILKALEKDRNRRYQTTSELAEDLRRYLANQPISARPPSVMYQLRSLARRNKTLVSAAAVVMIVLIGGMFATAWQAVVAQRAAAKARAISAFFQRTLTSADPMNQMQGPALLAPMAGSNLIAAPAKDRKVADAIDQAAAVIDLEFADHPELEAEVRHVVGRAYFGLGKWPQAQAQLTRALELRRELFGEEHPDTVKTMIELIGLSLFLPPNAAAAQRTRTLLGEALILAPRVLGPTHRDTLQLMRWHARALALFDKDFEQSIRIYEQIIPLQTTSLGRSDPATLYTQAELSSVLVSAERFAESERVAREAYQVAMRELPSDHIMVPTIQFFLGTSLEKQGKFDEAEPIMRQSMEGLRRHLGDAHNYTHQAMANYALLLKNMGRYTQAEQTARELLAMVQRSFGEDHPLVSGPAFGVADVLWDSGNHDVEEGRFDEAQAKFDEAESKYLLSIELALSAEDRDESHTNWMMGMFAAFLLERGKVDQAATMAIRSIEGHHAETKPDVKEMSQDLHVFASAMQQLNKLNEAEAAFKERAELEKGRRGPAHARTLLALNDLAWFYWGCQRLDDAEPLAREALEGYRRLNDPGARGLINTLDTLAVILVDRGRFDEAEALFAELESLWRDKHDKSEPLDAEFQLHYGKCLMHMERSVEAEQRLVEALKSLPGPAVPSPLRNQALDLLIELYDASGHSERATEYRDQRELAGPPTGSR